MNTINKGKIVELVSSWESCLPQLWLKDAKTVEVVTTPVKYILFIRALEAA